MSFAWNLGAYDEAVRTRLDALDRDRFAERLWRRDDSLWGADEARRKVASRRLGWLESPAAMRGRVPELEGFAGEVVRDGFRQAVLLGMGGSSLAPEVLRDVLGAKPEALALTVLDDTSPDAVRSVTAAHHPTTTLFLVSSKSGGTIEVSSFEKHFHAWVAAALPEPGRAFVAITDPGTPLETLAAARGYRRVFTNPADIGGRYSALSSFGLVPSALMGQNVGALLDSALDEAKTSGRDVPAAKHPALRLGAALGELARAGRDKVTLVLDGRLAPLGAWIEQLLAESTGKEGRGLVPVADEPLGTPDRYGDDRVFVATSIAGAPGGATAKLAALADAGHPVISWTIPDPYALGGEFLRWEIATAVAGAVLDVDPFDEPNVTEAKEATRAALERWRRDGAFTDELPEAGASEGRAVDVPSWLHETLRSRVTGSDAAVAWISGLLALVRPGDYVALLAYVHRTPERRAALERLRLAIRDATRAAVTIGYGPRFLHSTGQLHKGGPDTGVFLQLTADEGDEVAIPGEAWGFGALRAAQAAGDYEVLSRRARRVMRIHLGSDVEAGLEEFAEAIAAGTSIET